MSGDEEQGGIAVEEKMMTCSAECLTRLLEKQDLADVTIKLQGEKDTLKIHRLVLAMWSPVFKAMLFGPMAQGESIELPEDDPPAFKWMLDYMYSDCTTFPEVDTAVQVYMLSDKYQMDHLKIICSKYLMESVKAVTVPQVMNVATLLENEDLVKKCTEIIDKSPDEVFSSPSVGSFSSNSLQQLLDKDWPISSETIIFQGLLTWGRFQLTNQKDDVEKKESLRQKIDKFLPLIRFLSMTLEEFVRDVMTAYILTLEEATTIAERLAGKSMQDISLPRVCSEKEYARMRVHVSKLKVIQIQNSSCTKNDGNKEVEEGEERLLLEGIKGIQGRNEVFFHKLEYTSNISDIGELSVKNSTGEEIDKVEFDGQNVVFNKPIKITPDQEYSFVLKGSKKLLTASTYTIHNNGLISGNMMNGYTNPIKIHYWV